ncbi:GntR family transcriptional regulator [Micromonospora endophytica]|nr:GntR family transcriptional regulator [Micromonospora endophytica]
MSVRYQITGATAVEISTSIESGIRRAALAPGDPLPPVRALASELAVSPATVSRAYAELRRRGLIVTAGRHGT